MLPLLLFRPIQLILLFRLPHQLFLLPRPVMFRTKILPNLLTRLQLLSTSHQSHQMDPLISKLYTHLALVVVVVVMMVRKMHFQHLQAQAATSQLLMD